MMVEMQKVKKVIFFITLNWVINLMPGDLIIYHGFDSEPEKSTWISYIKQKGKAAIKWCKKRKPLLIGALVVTIAGTSFLVYRNTQGRVSTALDDSCFDKPHKFDGKLPNGEEGPAICKYGVVKVSQLPGLSQTRGDCVYYTFYNLLCLSLNDKESLKSRITYQLLEKEMKDIINREKPESVIGDNLSGLNGYGILHLLYNHPVINKNVNINPQESLLVKIIVNDDLTVPEHIEKHLTKNHPKKGESYLFMIKDPSRKHVSAAKATFNSKEDITLEIVDSFFSDASSYSMIQKIAASLQQASQKM